jgi:hypothetical protein
MDMNTFFNLYCNYLSDLTRGHVVVKLQPSTLFTVAFLALVSLTNPAKASSDYSIADSFVINKLCYFLYEMNESRGFVYSLKISRSGKLNSEKKRKYYLNGGIKIFETNGDSIVAIRKSMVPLIEFHEFVCPETIYSKKGARQKVSLYVLDSLEWDNTTFTFYHILCAHFDSSVVVQERMAEFSKCFI